MIRRKLPKLVEETYAVYYYGRPVKWDADQGKYRYVDTGEFSWEVPHRPCPKCNEVPTEEGHDPCIANLPGVKFACCGHGVEQGYITFEDNRTIRFKMEET